MDRYVLTVPYPRTGATQPQDVVISSQRRRFNVVMPDVLEAQETKVWPENG